MDIDFECRGRVKIELIAVDESLPQILWTKYFMESQGYNVADKIFYQDNKSTIILETYKGEIFLVRIRLIKGRLASSIVRQNKCGQTY